MQRRQARVGTGVGWRRLALAGAAALLACVIGAAAIYLIHATMPTSRREPPAAASRATPDVGRETASGDSSQGLPTPPSSETADAATAGADRPLAAAGSVETPPAGREPAVRPAGPTSASVESAQRTAPPLQAAPVTPVAPAALPSAGAGSVAAARQAPRLQAQQQLQCADAELLSRLVCEERVRLRFCRDRWNEHPDCMVDSPRPEP